MQNNSTRFDLAGVVKANGLDLDKLNEVDKFHPGFSHCVLMLASNPDRDVSGYRKGVEKRARAYLKKKRREGKMSKFGRKKKVFVDSKSAMAGSVNDSMKVQGSRETSSLGVENKTESYEFEMYNQVRQQFNYSESQVHPQNIYHGPVFNNCSFGSNPLDNVKSSDTREKGVASMPHQSRKRRFGEEVPGSKRKFKTASDLGLFL